MADEDVQVTDGTVGQIQTNPFNPTRVHVPLMPEYQSASCAASGWTLSCTRVLRSGQWSAHGKVFKRVCVFVYKCVLVFHPSPAWCGLATDALQGWLNGQERGRG